MIKILSKKQAFESRGDTRFAKDVLHVGTWLHPRTGEIVHFDTQRLTRLAENSNRLLSMGVKIPFPDGHSTASVDNLGDWPGPFVVYGDRLMCAVDVKDPVALGKVRSGAIDAVSACIESNFRDQKGNSYEEVITHVCATPYPVITGQKDFVALSTQDMIVPTELATMFGPGVVDEDLWKKAKAQAEKEGHGGDYAYITGIYKKMGGKFEHMMQHSTVSASATGTHTEVQKMDLTKLALLLGLPKDTPTDQILAAAEKKFGTVDEAMKASETKMSSIAAQLSALGFKLEDGKVVKLDATPKTEREKELEATLEESRLQNAQAKLSMAAAKAEAIVKSGKLPAAMQSRLERVLSIVGKTEAVALSTNDPRKVVHTSVDLATELSSLFDAVPSILKEKLSTLPSLTPADVEAAKKKAEELSTKAKDIASRNQPKEYASK